MSEHKTLVEVQHLQQYFPAGGVGKNRKYVQAVDDVSFAIRKGETLGLVGESGCGKTTTGRTLLRLYEPTGGKIYYDGNLLFDKEKNIAVDMLPYRRRMQIVFQDPYASLDPRMTIGDIVGEGIDIHHLAENDKDRHDKIIALLERVGRARKPLLPRVLRRSASARGHCPCTGREPRVHRLRRAGLRTGRVHSGTGREHVRGPAAGNGPDLPVHRP